MKRLNIVAALLFAVAGGGVAATGISTNAAAAEKVLKFKLVTVFIGEKDGERHLMGVTVFPDGRLGTKDFFDKPGANDAGSGRSTYYFDNGSIEATYTDTCPAGHCQGKYVIVSGTGEYQGATGTGIFDGVVGKASPLKNAGLLNVELNVKMP
jgi:hypothetical protein